MPRPEARVFPSPISHFQPILTMRILVVTSYVPFEMGGNERLAMALVRELRKRGHEADWLFTPQNRHYIFRSLMAGYLTSYLTDVREVDGKPIDRVVTIKFPSYAVRHPEQICWFAHRQREYYDQWEEWFAYQERIGRGRRRKIQKVILHRVDDYLLSHHVKKLYAISQNVANRLKLYGNHNADVLYPPPLLPERLRVEAYEPYIFSVSRLILPKRMDLLVDAMRHVTSPSIRVVITGKGAELPRLRDRVREYGLERRITLTGELDDAAVFEHLARCRAVFFAPRNEDYGLVAIEGMRSHKAVITCHDSGGPTELVRDGKNGFVLPPEPKAIARTIDQLAESEALAVKLGEQAYRDSLAVSWDRVVEKLTQPL